MIPLKHTDNHGQIKKRRLVRLRSWGNQQQNTIKIASRRSIQRQVKVQRIYLSSQSGRQWLTQTLSVCRWVCGSRFYDGLYLGIHVLWIGFR